MSLHQEVDVLRAIPLFARIEPSKLKLLAFTSERVRYSAGDFLFHQGDDADAAYIVLNGDAEVVVDTPNGPFKVAALGRHAIVGEMAVLMNSPRTAGVRALSQLEVLRISKELFLRLLTDFPQMAIEVMRELAVRLERTTNQLRTASTAKTDA
jgi:CRP-like cAMP-binding protein